MYKNRYWLVFLSIILAVALWYTGRATINLYHYYQLSAITTPVTIGWSIDSLSEEKYIVRAHYTFVAKETIYQAEYSFLDHPLRNGFAASEEMSRDTRSQWTVWYDPGHPEHSALQKTFPLKECLSAAVLWGLFLYFIGLGYYVQRRY